MKLTIRKLVIHTDDRGWLSELVRTEDVEGKPFGQVLITTAKPGKTKGNHYHKRKGEWYCVIKGNGLLRLTDRKTGEIEEIEMGEKNMILVEIPVGVLHSIENTGEDEMFLLCYTDEAFDPEDPDVFYE